MCVVTNDPGVKRMRKGKRYAARKGKVKEHDDRESQAEHFQKDAATIEVAALKKASRRPVTLKTHDCPLYYTPHKHHASFTYDEHFLCYDLEFYRFTVLPFC